MALPEAIAKLIAQGEQTYKQGAAAANPPPSTGGYVLQLGKISVSEAKTKTGNHTIITVPWTVTGSEVYPDYRFQKKYWMNSERDAADLAMLGTVVNSAAAAKAGTAGGAPSSLAENVDLLLRHADIAYVQTGITQSKSDDGTKTYYNFEFHSATIV